MCRKLIDAGHDPSTPLQVYRGDVLALTVATIGIGARVAINGKGIGFRWAEPVVAAPYSDLTERAAA
jgi:hypothetical protein